MSTRTPLTSLKRCAGDDFESCESSPSTPPRSPCFGGCDNISANPLNDESPSLKGRESDSEPDRKSSGNSPLLTAGRLSFAPSLLDHRGRIRRNSPPKKTSARKHDYIESIDSMVRDILTVTSARSTVSRKSLSDKALGISISRRNPQGYKRQSLTARGPPPVRQFPLKTLFEYDGSLTARVASSKPDQTTPRSFLQSDEDDSPCIHAKTLDENVPPVAKMPDLGEKLLRHEPTSAAISSDIAPTPVNQESVGNNRSSLDPFLLDTSPSPPTTPFKSVPQAPSPNISQVAVPKTSIVHQENDKIVTSSKVTKKNRDGLASHFYALFNRVAFDGRLANDIPIEWNQRFARVSGRTTFKRLKMTNVASCPPTPRVTQEDDDAPELPNYCRSDAMQDITDDVKFLPVRISLSTKLLTTVGRLKATLLHEMCHVAQRTLEANVTDSAHGPIFKKWVQLASERIPDVKVTISHAYTMDVSHYQWRCTKCDAVYQRVQKSIKTEEYVCSKCQGNLEYVGKFDKSGRPMRCAEKGISLYHQFVKANYAAVYEELQDPKLAMQKIGQLWQMSKG